jgi:hypothetical protein
VERAEESQPSLDLLYHPAILRHGNSPINLDSAVVSTHLTQPIDLPSISEETLITNKVTGISPDTPDKSMDYAMHALPTAESRIKHAM